ncbi:MAG: hypothetical protein HN846_02005 [Candidatus Pacebacteria bacterium]|jgi:hypothetical protein|nr:hypothetical protein [Candidatus Paceibacterota bacterium]MBT3512335.1 hypothetical protein [Candidatus Paceibacterota bacterium]MBT4004919.1 hypothetical protein [Candidatus Paceibacterota bacterium]MBT4359326.1 hypothetical protein [Candidatus Paceibacterota bacterium]MBT4681108.1 hypothetical protein [Candidatus Paceibacterota bacterium]
MNATEATPSNRKETQIVSNIEAQCRGCGNDWSKNGEVKLIVSYNGDTPSELEIDPKSRYGLVSECVSHHIDNGDGHNQFDFFQDGENIGYGNISSESHMGMFNSSILE